MGKKLLAGILGGLAFFFWSFVAHDVLPLGKAGIKEIPNEQTVLGSMKANMPERGCICCPALAFQRMPPGRNRPQPWKRACTRLKPGRQACWHIIQP